MPAKAGEFDDLEGAGKRLPYLESPHPYDPDWWVKKLLQREKLTVVPPALELLLKVEVGLAPSGTRPARPTSAVLPPDRSQERLGLARDEFLGDL